MSLIQKSARELLLLSSPLPDTLSRIFKERYGYEENALKWVSAKGSPCFALINYALHLEKNFCSSFPAKIAENSKFLPIYFFPSHSLEHKSNNSSGTKSCFYIGKFIIKCHSILKSH